MNESEGTTPPAEPIEIPLDRLDDETLRRIIEEFVLREGTDYGVSEISFETKVTQVRKQLVKGDVSLFFDPESESVTLLKTKKGL